MEPIYREYRAGSVGYALPSVALVGFAAGLAQLSRTGASLVVLLGAVVLIGAVIAVAYLAHGRSATIIDRGRLTIRSLWQTRVLAWPDIQLIEIEANVAALGQTNVAREIAVVYDRAGRKYVLPHLDSRSEPLLHAEVDRIRLVWEQFRGTDWTPRSEVTAKAARSRRAGDRATALLIALFAALGTWICGLVLILIVILTGAFELPFGLGAGLTGIVTAVAFLATFSVCLKRLRRDV
ncbi:hypothetical protein [Nocardia brasiliensis]|uniref:hypothetical protein n=1 Tax=Nocardia brasiliensis TaxID=37326 RepID=UPI002456662C|nr:hypothetical protein [Nocardia brasiliensis]